MRILRFIKIVDDDIVIRTDAVNNQVSSGLLYRNASNYSRVNFRTSVVLDTEFFC